jgi:hypothetical protein
VSRRVSAHLSVAGYQLTRERITRRLTSPVRL